MVKNLLVGAQLGLAFGAVVILLILMTDDAMLAKAKTAPMSLA
jgi:hypothetical protein